MDGDIYRYHIPRHLWGLAFGYTINGQYTCLHGRSIERCIRCSFRLECSRHKYGEDQWNTSSAFYRGNRPGSTE